MTSDAYFVATRTLTVLLPELIVVTAATAMMTAGAFVRLPRRIWAGISAGVLVAAIVALTRVWNLDIDPYAAVAVNDALSGYGRLAFLLTGLILLALAHDQVDDARAAEFFGAFLLLHAGAMLVASANELVFLFVGLELVSVPTYLLLYLPRRNAMTQEAATKYFYLSVFSSGLLLFGMAYLYGMTGVSNLKALSQVFHAAPGLFPLAFGLIAIVFIVAGLGFRVAAVPFHFYAPDVYEGSPTIMAALLAWVPKGIGILAMLRMLTSVIAGSSALADKAIVLTWVIAVVTMTLGNTVALLQENLRRLLAYSSIAHAGYLMIGIAASFRDISGDQGVLATGPYLGSQAVFFYLGAYALMTLGVFGIILALGSSRRPVETVDDLAGLGQTQPAAAFAMALCLFSLTGVPPMAGFLGKFQIFNAALSAGETDDTQLFHVLALIGVLNAAISAYYYLRIVIVMYFRPAPEPHLEARASWPTWLAIGVCAASSLILGIVPRPLDRAARAAGIAAVSRPEVGVRAPIATADRRAK